MISFFTSGRLGELSPEQKNMVAMMERNTQNLIELVNDLLDASKLESGTMRLDMASTDLHILVDELCEMMGPIAKEKEITLEEKLPADLRPVHADRAKCAESSSSAVDALKSPERRPHQLPARQGDGFMRVSVPIPASYRARDTTRLFRKYDQRAARDAQRKRHRARTYITRQLASFTAERSRLILKWGLGSPSAARFRSR